MSRSPLWLHLIVTVRRNPAVENFSHPDYHALMGVRDPVFAAEVEARIGSWLATGRAAWPGLQMAEDEFLGYLGERFPEGEGMALALEGANIADLYLAAACMLGQPRAIAAFERYCLAGMPEVLARFSQGHEFHDEVSQAVRERLFISRPGARARIEDYAGRGQLRSWVRVVAIRIAVDLLRKRGQEPFTKEAEELESLTTDDPELRILAEHYRGEVKAALREAFATLSAPQRNLLRLYYMDGLTIDEIAALKRIHRATVARRIAHCREQVAARTHQALIAQLGISSSQVDSFMRLVRSCLELSLDRWLDNRLVPQR